MTCQACEGRGLLVQEWTNADPDFAICLCETGRVWRQASNNGHATVPLWRVWCARWQVDPGRMYLLEDVYSASELAAVGLAVTAPTVNREAALLAAGKKR